MTSRLENGSDGVLDCECGREWDIERVVIGSGVVAVESHWR